MGGKISPEICAYCKGVKKLCGARVCPILLKFDYLKKDIFVTKSTNLQAISPPDFLVGEFSYPNVNLGPISNPNVEDKDEILLERLIQRGQYDLIDILKIRLNFLYSYNKVNVNIARKPTYPPEPIKELAISIKPLETELELLKYPKPRISLDADIPPIGLRAPLRKLEVVDNAYAPRKLEEAIYEDEKSSILLFELYSHGISNYHLMRLLSLGLLGKKNNKKLVPTRWAITATDSVLGNWFLKNIKRSPSFSKSAVYYHSHLGNEYYIWIIPSDYWAFEMFEIWMPMSVWVRRPGKPVLIHVYESYNGKPNKMDGGYYAIRFSVLEALQRWRRKGKVIAFRIINPEYFAGVGSWQIREGVRIALTKKPLLHGDFDEIRSQIFGLIREKTGLDLEGKSRVIKMVKEVKLLDFIDSYS